MIKLALDNGAEPNLLLFAAIDFKPTWKDQFNYQDPRKFALDWAEIAVSYGADVNATRTDDERKQRPAIHFLYENFSEKMMDFMIAHGASVDTQSPHGNTLLMRAVLDAKTDMAEYFLKKGADPLRERRDGKFPLQQLQRHEKIKQGRKEALLMLMMQHVKPKAEDKLPPPPSPPPKKAEVKKEERGIVAPRTARFSHNRDDKPAEKHSFSL